ncbi:hypothetical protein HV186_19520 [Citrobacter freundii]|uniref:hypothetical protein n=1 Tax=Citrobacter freundii TaxID=546 RepID=UPI0015E9FB23|nr:hypothetical protein [Citrobacter freundii]QLY53818.1 hypothetical protein HV186_19520 [Citrobacter freundii]
MLVSYNEIKHLSDIHTHYTINPDIFDRNSNTTSIRQLIGRLWDMASNADYRVCFVDTDLFGPAGFAMPGNKKMNELPSLLFFIGSSSCFEDIERAWTHESIHLQQLISERLSLGDHGELYWEGVSHHLLTLPELHYAEGHPGFSEQVINVLKYYAQPWELEAQHETWDITIPTFRIGKSLVDKYGTCWKNTWDEEKRKALINHHGLEYAFRDLLI